MIRTQVTSEDLADLALAIKFEEDAKLMRRDLLRNLRAAVKPAVAGAKSSIMSMDSGGLRQPGGSIRRAVARQIKTEVKLGGHSAKVKVKVKKKNMPRGFNNAPRVLHDAAGWRHPVFPKKGRKDQAVWAPQVGKPRWFDDPMLAHRAEYRAAVKAAMDKAAERIARSV